MTGGTGQVPEQPHRREAGRPEEPGAFDEFYRSTYRDLLRTAMYAGGSREEAEDAVSAAMAEVLQRWANIQHPRAYARQAVVSQLVRDRTRGLDRVRRRQGQLRPAAGDGIDPGLSAWEDRQWVLQLLGSLTPAQREVMALVVDDFTAQEVAALLGKTDGAVRRNLRDAQERLRRTVQGDDRGDMQAPARHSSQFGRLADDA